MPAPAGVVENGPGMIVTPAQAAAIIETGQADQVAIARTRAP